MGRKKLTICWEKTAGGQYGTPKVNNLLRKNRRRPIWDAKSYQIVEKKPPEANMGRQVDKKLTICRKKTAGG